MERNTYIPKLNLPQFPQRIDDLAPDFIRNIQLHHAHVRGAKHGVLFGHHGGRTKRALERGELYRRLNIEPVKTDCCARWLVMVLGFELFSSC